MLVGFSVCIYLCFFHPPTDKTLKYCTLTSQNYVSFCFDCSISFTFCSICCWQSSPAEGSITPCKRSTAKGRRERKLVRREDFSNKKSVWRVEQIMTLRMERKILSRKTADTDSQTVKCSLLLEKTITDTKVWHHATLHIIYIEHNTLLWSAMKSSSDLVCYNVSEYVLAFRSFWIL